MSQTVPSASLQNDGIIPDVLSQFYASMSMLSLPMVFEENNITVSCGDTLTPTESLYRPRFFLPPDVPSDGFYTIIGLDPDGPSRRRPRMRCILHLMQINIPASVTDLKAAGIVHVNYEPPGPPPNSGKHRYVFLLYHHNSAIDGSKLPKFTGIGGRPNQRVEVLERQLSQAGGGRMKLVAVNWFDAEWDEQVNKNMFGKYGWGHIYFCVLHGYSDEAKSRPHQMVLDEKLYGIVLKREVSLDQSQLCLGLEDAIYADEFRSLKGNSFIGKCRSSPRNITFTLDS